MVPRLCTIPVSQLTVLGSGDLMPALAYGFEVSEAGVGSVVELSLAEAAARPDWLISCFVQAGGYCMSYWCVVGAVFRFADNVAHAWVDPARFLRSFHLMAEDPDIRALEREFPSLRKLCGTWGAPYDSTQLAALARWLDRHFSLPSPESGLEAFVRLGPPAADQMVGWTHLHVADPPKLLEESGAAAGVVTRGPFGAPEAELLRRLGADAFAGAAPKLFLLWENSD